jgi:hypothetical protein
MWTLMGNERAGGPPLRRSPPSLFELWRTRPESLRGSKETCHTTKRTHRRRCFEGGYDGFGTGFGAISDADAMEWVLGLMKAFWSLEDRWCGGRCFDKLSMTDRGEKDLEETAPRKFLDRRMA